VVLKLPRALACTQSRYKGGAATLVGGADARRFSIGAEDVHYEVPLQLCAQVCARARACAVTCLMHRQPRASV
jgi:hypothetical protein